MKLATREKTIEPAIKSSKDLLTELFYKIITQISVSPHTLQFGMITLLVSGYLIFCRVNNVLQVTGFSYILIIVV